MLKTSKRESGTEYVRSYEKTRGVSLISSPGRESERFAYAQNLYIDYEGGADALESIPGFRRLTVYEGKIHGIYSHSAGEGEEYILVHAGTSLYRFKESERDGITVQTPIATLEDAPSHAFTFGKKIYIADTKSIFSVSPDGGVSAFGEGDFLPYVPTTYKNGRAVEGRNLLTPIFHEEMLVGAADEVSYCSPEITFAVESEREGTCVVTGSKKNIVGDLYIPSFAMIGGKRYAVVGIGPRAFEKQVQISSLTTGANLEHIGYSAFGNCSELKQIVLASTVKTVGEYAFYGAKYLEKLYLGASLNRISSAAFAGTNLSFEVCYEGDIEQYSKIENLDALGERTVYFNTKYKKAKVAIPVYSAADTLIDVKVGAASVDFIYEKERGIVSLFFDDRSSIEGKELIIKGAFGNSKSEFGAVELPEGSDICSLILSASKSAIFDGRVFLSGCRELWGCVFFCGRTMLGELCPTYFPEDCFFVDGAGTYPVRELLAASSSLIVFKAGDDGAGSIFYHRREEEDGKTRYPVTYVHGGACANGGAINLLDRALFVSDSGICELCGSSDSDSKEIRIRSFDISPALNTKSSGTALCSWLGYLTVISGEKIFLGDPKGDEFDWYILSGVGSYRSDSRVYRYSDTAEEEGYSVSARVGERVEGTVISEIASGKLCYYTLEGSEKISVSPTSEWSGGRFYPPTAVCSHSGLLFFGTELGDLCIFNNDKRGAYTDEEISRFAPGEYESIYSKRIPPRYYTFLNHSPEYILKTKTDPCEFPYLRKSTVRGTAVLKTKNLSDTKIEIKVRTDSEEKSLGSYSPGISSDFKTLVFPECERGWIEKELSFYSDEYMCPIGICALHYSYKIKGKIKR